MRIRKPAMTMSEQRQSGLDQIGDVARLAKVTGPVCFARVSMAHVDAVLQIRQFGERQRAGLQADQHDDSRHGSARGRCPRPERPGTSGCTGHRSADRTAKIALTMVTWSMRSGISTISSRARTRAISLQQGVALHKPGRICAPFAQGPASMPVRSRCRISKPAPWARYRRCRWSSCRCGPGDNRS